MANQELIDWIKTHRQGRSSQEIKEHLVNHGYEINEINKAREVYRNKALVKLESLES